MPDPIEIANAGTDYELRVVAHGDGSLEVRVDLVLSRSGRERLHFPRLTPSEARKLAASIERVADKLDRA